MFARAANKPTLPPGFHLLIAAQFASALADNALLIVAIADLQRQGHPAWWAPMLKFSFTIPYVVLAPLVGPLADSVRKGRLMMAMNLLKVLGVLALLAGLSPLAAFAVIGVGAAAYAPAKYGLVTELVATRDLVAANAWIEVTTVCAVLLGVALGGALVSPVAAAWSLGAWPTLAPLDAAVMAVLGVYALAAALNLGIPDSGARYRRTHRAPHALWRSFLRAHRRLWSDAEGGLSMSVTTLFWGVAAVLQFAVLRWGVDDLGLGLDGAAYLQAAVAFGIIGGASIAGRQVSLSRATCVLPLGVLMGALVPLVWCIDRVSIAVALLLAIGALGGGLVVPLNALLQHRGHLLLSAGRSIAVQNFNENLSVMAMLLGFAALMALEIPVRGVIASLGLLVACFVGLLYLRDRGRRLREFKAGGV